MIGKEVKTEAARGVEKVLFKHDFSVIAIDRRIKMYVIQTKIKISKLKFVN